MYRIWATPEPASVAASVTASGAGYVVAALHGEPLHDADDDGAVPSSWMVTDLTDSALPTWSYARKRISVVAEIVTVPVASVLEAFGSVPSVV